MPEVVQTWIDTHDYRLVEEVQGRILKDYADDFAKHANADTAIKLRAIIRTEIPAFGAFLCMFCSG